MKSEAITWRDLKKKQTTFRSILAMTSMPAKRLAKKKASTLAIMTGES
ncbi:MAG: hypothetical protein ACLQBD_15455 [Syntrophobacteraceae bacterium]